MSTEEFDRTEPVIEINWTLADVLDMAKDRGIEPAVAVERAREWGKYITDTASGIAGEQLASVIELNTP